MSLSVIRLKELLNYNLNTGDFTWLQNRSRNAKIGDIAGTTQTVRGISYIRIFIEGKSYSAHGLAWLYMTGFWPNYQIDHEDTDGCNNRWKNLREATQSQNQINKHIYKNNSSGRKGISKIKGYNKWRAYINIKGKQTYLGIFDSFDKACAARELAEQNFYDEFRRTM